MIGVPARGHGEAETFHLWVFSDSHVATDRAVSAVIRNGMGFIPPAGYPESLANALHLVFSEQTGNVQQHGKTPEGKGAPMVLILIARVKPIRRMSQQKP